MDNTLAMKSAVPMDPPQPTVQDQSKQDHWSLQLIGGLTLANTMVSALAIFWVFMEYGLAA